jgi:cysteinyl-tRNA synthetase
MLTVYDTFSREKKPFRPARDGRVGVYVCGMTVQGPPHVGHMVAFVAGDVVRRYLRYLGYDVTYVQNFTDIDDKIIEKAAELGVTAREVAETNIQAYFRHARYLGVLDADHYPRVTNHIEDIVAYIENLVEKGFAYEAGGDVYFRVRRFPDYGMLSGRNVDDLVSGARVEIGESKEDPLDFALWKKAKPEEPGWDSPWGRGRPGWHIECSVMSMKYLGETLDMHGGGRDLIFPHHENEIAQSEALSGKRFVNFWIHNGLLNLGGEKMSKSTGHFFSMEDVSAEFSGEVIRFYLLSSHFRSQAEFSRERLLEASASFRRLENLVVEVDARLRATEGRAARVVSEEGERIRELCGGVRERFLEAMNDDFNTGRALGHLFDLVREVNRAFQEGGGTFARDREALERVRDTVAELDRAVGIFAHGLPGAERREESIPEEVLSWAEERAEARRTKDWSRADRLREKIKEAGYTVEDTPDGYRLHADSGSP